MVISALKLLAGFFIGSLSLIGFFTIFAILNPLPIDIKNDEVQSTLVGERDSSRIETMQRSQTEIKRNNPIIYDMFSSNFINNERSKSFEGSFGNWRVGCTEADSNPLLNTCQMIQEIRLKETNQKLVTVGFFINSKEEYQLELAVPFGLDLRNKLIFDVGKENMGLDVLVVTCLQTNCVAIENLNTKFLQQLQDDPVAKLIMSSFTQQNIILEIDFHGFSEGIHRINKLLHP